MDTEEHHPRFELSPITECVFLGTNICCLAKSHIQILLDLGVTAEIDLEKERQDMAPDVEAYLWLPVADKTAPTTDQFAAGVALLKDMTERGKKVYVHCQYGHGRSPALVAAYFISQGKTVDEAIAEIQAARPEIHLEDVQKEALRKFAATV